MQSNTLLWCACGTALSVIASAGSAAVINYGDFMGDNLLYTSVTETSLEPEVLYGAPSISGDSLEFVTPGFASESGPGESDFRDGRLTTEVCDTNGGTIESLTVCFFGAFFVFDPGAFTTVSSFLFVDTPDGLYEGSFELTRSGTDTPGSGSWSGEFTVYFPATTCASVTLDTMLFSLGDDGTSFIDIKGLNIKPNVPAPSTASLLVAAGLVASRRRR